MTYLARKFERDHPGLKVASDKRAMQKLRREAERVKRVLSSQHQVRVEVEALLEGHDLSETLTRARFEELNADLFKRTLKPVAKVLAAAGVKKVEVDEIVLVGGSTRIPKVQQLIKDYFNGKEPNRGINPDEAVAYGAAVQAAILGGGDRAPDGVVLLDVNPLSLGIETVGGVFTKLIESSSVIPTKKTQTFSTHTDNQASVMIQVYEGERSMTKDNHMLGQFELTGIPPAPRGVPQIEVTFSLDANSILQVSAKDKGSGATKEYTITTEKGRLSEAEIERLKQEAVDFAEEDQAAKERVVERNALEALALSVRRQLREDAESAAGSGADADAVEEAIQDTLDWLDENQEADADDFRERRQELEDATASLFQRTRGAHDDATDDFDDFEDFDDEL